MNQEEIQAPLIHHQVLVDYFNSYLVHGRHMVDLPMHHGLSMHLWVLNGQ